MRSFMLMLKTGIVYSANVCQQGLSLEERNTTRKTEEIQVEQEDNVGIVFRTKKKRTVCLTYKLVAKLDAVRREVSEQFGVERWSGLLSSQVEEREEILECVKRVLFNREIEHVTVFNTLEELLFFDNIKYVSATESLLSVLQLAVDLEYTELDELCNKVFYRMDGLTCLLSTLLEITLNKKDGSKSVESIVAKFVEDVRSDSSKLKETYNKMKDVCRIKWRVNNKVLKRLFSKSRLIEKEELFKAYMYCNNNNLKNYKTLLRLRIIEYPDEERDYRDALGVCTIEKYTKDNAKGNEAETTIVEIDVNRHKIRDNDILKCNWHQLVIDKDADPSVVFYDRRHREVDALILENITEKRASGLIKNKVVVRKYLNVNNVEGTIDFVDTEKVEEVRIINVGNIKFCHVNKQGVFVNTKTLNIESTNLDILLCDDGSQLFLNLEKLTITECTITNKIYKIVSENIRVVYIKKCTFTRDVTAESMRARVKCKSMLVDESTCNVFLTAPNNEELRRQIENKNRDDQEAHRASQMLRASVSCSGIAEMIRENTKHITDVRESIRKSVVCAYTTYKLYINTIKSVEEKIVFLEVVSIKDYVDLKKTCGLKSTRYLKVLWLEYNTESIESLKIEKHSLDVLVVSNAYGNGLEVLVKKLFDNKLACLDLSFIRHAKTKEALLSYFIGLRVLSITIEGGLFYEEYNDVFSGIRKLEKLEVIETLLLDWRNCDNERIESFELARSIMDECKRIKRVVTVIYEYDIERYKVLGQVLVLYDNRKYKTSMEQCWMKRGVCARAVKEVTLVDREVQEVLYQEYLVKEEFKGNRRAFLKNLEITYELVA